MLRPLSLIFACAPIALPALTLDFPATATMAMEETRALDSTAIATGPASGEAAAMLRPRGEVTLQAWRIDTAGLTTLQILAPLAQQLRDAGFETLLECVARTCGGFDFRYALEILPAPDMYVSLGDYRYLSARKDEEVLSILVSRSSRAGFVQITRIGPPAVDGALAVSTRSPVAPDGPIGDFATTLDARGRVILSDLAFETGSSNLGPGEFASLRALADYLVAAPDRRVALVGHTDATGSLEGNIALSRRRARSVLDRLVSAYGVNPAQLAAEGMGYLAPTASNLTDIGREANRRVEVILTSTD
ncbi:OmpA family protein [Roseisalinus antarcticus]|uniref:Peptidoglycan-binding protein ArfA n=1 Tax=Roseisalinus antarcticus TaxID=254357 RepID=A0A1Y5TDW1_9RHOB|nr:OmpA family protein [Roseisalinus antarcticus]SLN58140.1 Peptidoglycan-binding protein ArfA [Roseisalinus antarcticus]